MPTHEPKIANSGQLQKYLTGFKLIFLTNLILIKFHCCFCQVYKVTTRKYHIYFMKKKDLPKISKLQDDVIHPGSFQLWHLSNLKKMTVI